MDPGWDPWEAVRMGHIQGGRLQELVPYVRFLGKRSLLLAAGRPISSALPSRFLPTYLVEEAQARESFHSFQAMGGRSL